MRTFLISGIVQTRNVHHVHPVYFSVEMLLQNVGDTQISFDRTAKEYNFFECEVQFHFPSRTNLLEKKGVFQQENTELQIGPQLFFEEVASTITPLIYSRGGGNKQGEGVKKL